ncbi:uncharacterized protein LOC143214172 [Lasioglossum baleicum]|uniref:uncharacterized protein LOC143214172 n=1 Tax=Lasioglossum baleicum TaxID=434251 RepID=UPI003FCD6045
MESATGREKGEEIEGMKGTEEQNGMALMMQMCSEMSEGMRGMMEEMKRMRKEMEEGRQEAREEARRTRKEIEELKKREEEERRRLEGKIEGMEAERKEWEKKEEEEKGKWLREIEERMKERKKEEREKEEIGQREQERRLKEIVIEWERKEKQERKNNIIIRGEEIENRVETKQIVKDILEKMVEAEVEINEAAEIGRGKRAILVKLGSWEEKRKVMDAKRKLKGRKLYIDDDLTRKEREVQETLREKAREERENGNKTNVGYKKIWIGETVWIWNEQTGQLIKKEGTKGGERGDTGRGGRGRGEKRGR